MKKNYFKQLTILAIMLILSVSVQAQWTQLGQDIDGEADWDESGYSVSLSADGTIVAIGAPNNNGYTGHVRVYKRDASNWTQLGVDIDGEATWDDSGCSVSLSADGSVLAIGAYGNNGNGVEAGHVRVYQYIVGMWIQIGSDIDGEAGGDKSGTSVSLSANGSIVAIGAPYNNTGYVRVYQNNAGSWTQIGSDIDGEALGDRSGSSVSLSADGTIVAIGAPNNNGYTGHVRVYKNIAGTWTQIGSDIDGETADDVSGYSVSLSADGSVVAIGAYGNDGNGVEAGHVRVYQNNAGSWTQIGSDIDGEAAGDDSGYSVSLSDNGSVLAIGAPSNDSLTGHVRIYENNAGNWTQIGSDIDGETQWNGSGWSVSLSADGTEVAIGAVYNSDNGTYAGHVRVFNNPNVGVDEISNMVDVGVYPNPTTGKITIECEGMERVEVVDITGKLVYEIPVSNDVLEIDISAFSKGVYFVKVFSAEGVAVERVVLE
jgi:hypothetical protein